MSYPFRTVPGGAVIIASTPTRTPSKFTDKDGNPFYHRQIFDLTLASGARLVGCAQCGFTHNTSAGVRTHFHHHATPKATYRENNRDIFFAAETQAERVRVFELHMADCLRAREAGTPLSDLLDREAREAFETNYARTLAESTIVLAPTLPIISYTPADDDVDTADVLATLSDYAVVKRENVKLTTELADAKLAMKRLVIELDEHRDRWSVVLTAVRAGR